MTFGMSIETFTLIHVVISLVALASGFIVLFGMLAGKRLDALTALFLLTTVLTNVTALLFPYHHITPGIIIAVLSLVLLLFTLLARYAMHLAGTWRSIYVVTAVVSLYFNVVVLIVQSFDKVHALKALAPTMSAPPFLITQIVAMVLFIVLGVFAVKKFRV